jgi:hypothetical protein
LRALCPLRGVEVQVLSSACKAFEGTPERVPSTFIGS